MEWGMSADAINYLFSTTTAKTQARLDTLAGSVLGQGIDFFQAEKYGEAINAFKRSAALSPFSNNSATAYKYIGQAYLKQEKPEEAIKTYQEAIRIYPRRAEFHLALADIYSTNGQTEEALASYEAAVKLDPDDSESRYSLGQAYLAAGDTASARTQFSAVARLNPISAAGFYGLGQTARADGDLGDAVEWLTKAISINKGFELAYVELGSAYADMGNFQKAEDQLRILQSKDSGKTTDLENYMAQARDPKMISALSPDGFRSTMRPKTPVAALSATLADANKSKLFSINIAFSKDMDEASILNRYNWVISRANIRNNGGVYNYGLPVQPTEAAISPIPDYITFDKETNTATVRFRIAQNSTANATIDPSGIVFKFNGVDAYGKAMDKSADEYAGFSGIA